MRKISFGFIYIITLSVCAFAQTYKGEYSFIYDFQQPDARSEAMGKLQGALYDSPLSSLYNPASSSFACGLNLSYNHLQPKFSLGSNDSKHDVFSAGYNFHKYGAAAFSFRQFSFGKVIFTNMEHPDGTGEYFIPEIFNYTFNYSYSPFRDLSVGFNLNYFVDKQVINKSPTAWIYDFGIMKLFRQNTETSSSNIILSGSISNITNSEIKYNSEYYLTAMEHVFKNYLPSELRIGAAYEYENKLQLSGFEIIKAMLACEYNDPVNSKLFTTYKAGVEITLLELLKLRMGYYNEKINDNSVNNNIESLSEFTYGFGLNLPLNKITARRIPIDIQFDYVNLPIPIYNSSFKIDKDYSAISLNAKIIL